jgi:lipid II:glycine glycyltransferase (peptidoglycan interpeptide bridge formation enzyme)
MIGKKILKREYKTIYIDLTKDKNEILAAADRHSVQKNISRAIRRGVEVRDITNDNSLLYEYAKMLFKSKSDLMIADKTFNEYHDEILDLVSDGKFNVLMAFWVGLPIAAVGCVISAVEIREKYLTRNYINDELKLYGVDLLRWNIIILGQSLGCSVYDMGGIMDTSDKLRNIARNKLKWNGKIMTLTKYA